MCIRDREQTILGLNLEDGDDDNDDDELKNIWREQKMVNMVCIVITRRILLLLEIVYGLWRLLTYKDAPEEKFCTPDDLRNYIKELFDTQSVHKNNDQTTGKLK